MTDSVGHASALNDAALADFHEALLQSKRIIAVLGAGLSVASGLPTYRSAGSQAVWRNHDVSEIVTPVAFRHDPGLVWQYNTHMRRLALAAEPNRAHYALAELARRVPGFMTLSQNVDNLSPRAGHPPGQLRELHGNLFNLRCCDEVTCGYVEKGNLKDPLTPALASVREETTAAPVASPDRKRLKATAWLLDGIARKNRQILGSDYQDLAPTRADQAALKSEGREDDESRLAAVPEPSKLSPKDLPQCPKCSASLLRPDVVWFGEALPAELMEEVDAMFADSQPIDLCIVVGTSGSVWPAAGFSDLARKKGARIAVINLRAEDVKNLRPGVDWMFEGDASTVVPELLKPIVGDLGDIVMPQT